MRRPPAFHDQIKKGRVIHAPVALECRMETKPLTALTAAMTTGWDDNWNHSPATTQPLRFLDTTFTDPIDSFPPNPYFAQAPPIVPPVSLKDV